ncbi:hypothetical protein ACVXG9_19340 [Escherichia coli]
MIALGRSMKSDGFHEELIMSSLLGVSFVGAFLVARFLLSCLIYVGLLRLLSAVLWS